VISNSNSLFQNISIPNGWTVSSVSELGRVVTGGTPRTSVAEFWGGGIPWITPTDIDLNRHQVISERTISEAGLNQVGELPPGSVLVTCIASLGKNAILRVRGACNQQINAIIPDVNVSTTDFVYYALEFAVPRLKLMAGTTATPMVSKKTFMTLPILMPIEVLEQTAIAAALSDVDALIVSLDKVIAKKRDIKQGAMQQLLTGKNRLHGFSGEWVPLRLGDIAAMSSGGTPPSKVKEFYGGQIKWASITDMTKDGKYLSNTDEKLTELGLLNSSAVIYKSPVILYAMYASLGEVCISLQEVSSSQAILGISPSSKIDLEFLYYLLLAYKPTVKTLGQQGTQSNLNKGMVQDFVFAMPTDKREQKAIAEVLSDIDTEIGALVARREKTALIKTGMMQELLTGRARLL
jgi:type I restriction enzyme S subunit